MTEKIRIKDLIEKTNTGRAISPTYVRKVVKQFYEVPCKQLFEKILEKKEAEEFGTTLNKMLNNDDVERSLGDSLNHYREQVQHPPLIPADILAAISFAGALNKSPSSITFFSLPVEDYLELAEKKEWYEKWYSSDAQAWKRDHSGHSPRIADVMRNCFEAMEHAPDQVLYFSPESIPGFLPPESINTPFRRSGEKIKDFDEIHLAATWIYILMIEVPHLLIKNGLLSEKTEAQN